jgi:hypothetical protein
MLSPWTLPTGTPAAGEAMHILGSPDFSALAAEMPAIFGHLLHHFYVGLMGGPIDEKSGLALSRLVHRIALRASSFRMPLEISDRNVSPTI